MQNGKEAQNIPMIVRRGQTTLRMIVRRMAAFHKLATFLPVGSFFANQQLFRRPLRFSPFFAGQQPAKNSPADQRKTRRSAKKVPTGEKAANWQKCTPLVKTRWPNGEKAADWQND
jgi:hypothetical protein